MVRVGSKREGTKVRNLFALRRTENIVQARRSRTFGSQMGSVDVCVYWEGGNCSWVGWGRGQPACRWRTLALMIAISASITGERPGVNTPRKGDPYRSIAVLCGSCAIYCRQTDSVKMCIVVMWTTWYSLLSMVCWCQHHHSLSSL